MKKSVWCILGVAASFIAIIWGAYRMHGAPSIGIDDANIFFSYAENLASNKEMTYGQNGGRVEGFTSILWMLYCALMFWIGANETGILISCVLFLMGTQLIVVKVLRSCLPKTSARIFFIIAYLLMILCSPAYMIWMSITLMDTCMWGFDIAWMSYWMAFPPRSARAMVAAAVPFMLAPLIRPEGLVIAPLFVVLLWLRWRMCGCRAPVRGCIGIGLSVAFSIAALISFRLIYFGYPFPNTYYAKVSPSLIYNLIEGSRYLMEFILSGSLICAAFFCILAGCVLWLGRLMDRMWHEDRRRVIRGIDMGTGTALCFSSLGLLFIPVLSGGDHFAMSRFYQPVYPLLCCGVIIATSRTVSALKADSVAPFLPVKNNRFQSIGLGILLFSWLFACSSRYTWLSLKLVVPPIRHEFRIAESGVAMGKRLNAIFSAGDKYPSVGVLLAGGIARSYRGPIIDLFGLNNEFIAHFSGARKGLKNHAAFEIDAFLAVSPDVFPASPPVAGQEEMYTNWLKGIHKDQRFISGWRYGILTSPAGTASISAFVKKEYADFLKTQTNIVFRETMLWNGNQWIGTDDQN